MAYVPVAERRRQFARATTKVVTKHGVAGATARRITPDAQAPSASVRYCFSRKDELMKAVHDYVAGDFIDAIKSATADSIGIADPCPRPATRRGPAWQMPPEEQVATWELVLPGMRRPGEAGKNRAVYEAFATAMARDPQGRGGARRRGADPEAETLARLVIAGMEGITLEYVVGRDRERADKLVDTPARAAGSAPGSRRRQA
ncbi:TetR/AcrR family transcriptional regulator [Streptomyces sp. NPDC056390]|uniref:TetR/AcrR family transcriptional regulator n=1 Tax=Streptomyces sp. NPDC056390 TaxID=3345806 RepID=UPI0035DD6A72